MENDRRNVLGESKRSTWWRSLSIQNCSRLCLGPNRRANSCRGYAQTNCDELPAQILEIAQHRCALKLEKPGSYAARVLHFNSRNVAISDESAEIYFRYRMTRRGLAARCSEIALFLAGSSNAVTKKFRFVVIALVGRDSVEL